VSRGGSTALSYVSPSCALLWAYYAALVLDLALGYIWLAEAIGWATCLLAAAIWFYGGLWKRLTV